MSEGEGREDRSEVEHVEALWRSAEAQAQEVGDALMQALHDLTVANGNRHRLVAERDRLREAAREAHYALRDAGEPALWARNILASALAGSVSDKDREPTWESVDRIDLTTGDAIEAYVIDAEGFEWCRATVLSVDPLRVRWSDGTEKSWVDRPDDCLPRLRRSVSDKDRAPKR